MKSKYTRGSYIHQALSRLSRQPLGESSLRKEIASISIARFHDTVIQPLISDGLVVNNSGILNITEKGERKMEELGPIKEKLPPQHASARRINIIAGTYDGKELMPQQNRPNGNDHLLLPSRSGNRLNYRDGRVEMLS